LLGKLGDRLLKSSWCKSAISNGDFATAIQNLQAYLKNTPNDPKALIYLNNARIGTKKSYTIAISAPIGSDVNSALEMLRGVAQAQNKINQAGGINQVPLRVLIADDDNKPDTAKKIAEELVKNPDVIGVVGHYASDVTLAAGEVYQAGKLAAISPVSTSIKLTGFGNYIFRTVPSNSVAAKALADYMRSQLRKKKAAIFYNSKSDYSESFKSEFVKFLPQGGGQVSKDLVFDLSDPNFNTAQSVEKSIESGAEVLVLLPNSGKLDDTMQVVKANNKRLPILGGDDVYAPKTLQAGAANANGMIVAVPWHILASDPNFRDTSRKLWKADVNWRTAMSYDATIALITGLQQNPTREGLAQTLRSQDFVAKGATGEVKFDAKGDRGNRGIQLVKIQANPQSRSKYGYDFEPVP
jgi:branched-chain amino acid transport system substrate-binding protein